LIGANGAGKSTLLQLLLGLLPADHGQVHCGNKSLKDLSRTEIAKEMAFVPQDHTVDYPFNVREMVAMGRTPYLGSYQPETSMDLEFIEQALKRTDLSQYAERRADQLSGGERQRVFIARALAQQAEILLLDEPTANLDLCHQLDLMNLVKSLTSEGKLAIAAIHDLSLASRFCDRLILLSGGNAVVDGTPEEVLTVENLRQYFSIEASVVKDEADRGLRISALKSISS
ncbi:ABC transporter ATP-binding protein, partial [Neptuniibacter sp.]|uniref:ABC transporter ATP-binding protein n=1 Tax=Neptuniibacter sp. TaxID=1962643 RepID=UPI00261EA6CE